MPANDPDLQKRIDEADRISREIADLERRQAPKLVDDGKVDPQKWLADYDHVRHNWTDRINKAKDQMIQTLLDFTNKIPPTDDKRSERLDRLNNFIKSDCTAVPVYPELRQSGLTYVRERLQMERQYLAELRRLSRQQVRGQDHNSYVMERLRNDIAKAENAIKSLEIIEPALLALPEKADHVISDTRSPDPQQRPPDEPTAPSTSEAETPISKNWKVVPDPGPPLPNWPVEFPWRELRGIHPAVIVYPQGPSTSLLFGLSRDGPLNYGGSYDKLLAADIMNGKPIGPMIGNVHRQFRPTDLHWRPALSRDGERVAILGSRQTIRIVHARTAKVQHELVVPTKEFTELCLFFPQPNRLLALDLAHTKKAFLFDLDKGQHLLSFSLDNDVEQQTGYVAISPGGRFLALACKESSGLPNLIVIFDLTTGQMVGELYPGGRGGRLTSSIGGLAFSPDGQELGAFVRIPDKANLFAEAPTFMVWKLSTGREVTRVTIDTGNRGNLITFKSPEPVQWFPDQKAVLIHHQLVIHRTDGTLLDVVEGEGNFDANFATRIIDDHRLLVATHGNKLIVKRVKRTPSR